MGCVWGSNAAATWRKPDAAVEDSPLSQPLQPAGFGGGATAPGNHALKQVDEPKVIARSTPAPVAAKDIEKVLAQHECDSNLPAPAHVAQSTPTPTIDVRRLRAGDVWHGVKMVALMPRQGIWADKVLRAVCPRTAQNWCVKVTKNRTLSALFTSFDVESLRCHLPRQVHDLECCRHLRQDRGVVSCEWVGDDLATTVPSSLKHISAGWCGLSAVLNWLHHRCGDMHCDIAPYNICVRQATGVWVVIDFETSQPLRLLHGNIMKQGGMFNLPRRVEFASVAQHQRYSHPDVAVGGVDDHEALLYSVLWVLLHRHHKPAVDVNVEVNASGCLQNESEGPCGCMWCEIPDEVDFGQRCAEEEERVRTRVQDGPHAGELLDEEADDYMGQAVTHHEWRVLAAKRQLPMLLGVDGGTTSGPVRPFDRLSFNERCAIAGVQRLLHEARDTSADNSLSSEYLEQVQKLASSISASRKCVLM